MLRFRLRRAQMNCFNTASGMDCMQCPLSNSAARRFKSFNTASGMDCMQ